MLVAGSCVIDSDKWIIMIIIGIIVIMIIIMIIIGIIIIMIIIGIIVIMIMMIIGSGSAVQDVSN